MRISEGRFSMPKVSIVIPVYNVEKYLRECLNSVCSQTLTDIEIICVDDGSTDQSGSILDEYAAGDDRFHIIHKENEGYGKAMNVGMDAVTAPYVGIVESDDIIVPDMYENLYQLMKEKKVDVIKADFYEFYVNKDGRRIEEYCPLMSNPQYTNMYGTVMNAYTHEDVFRFAKYTWSGIYSTEFLRRENILHNETPGASYQDNGFWFQTMVKAESIYFVNRAFYQYRIDNPNSSVYSKAKVFAVCDEYDFVHRILDEMGEKGRLFYGWANFIRIRDCIGNITRVSDENKLILAQQVKKDFIEAVKANEIDVKLYANYLKIKVFDILVNPEEYIIKENKRREKIVEITKEFDTIILYGAGFIGQKVQSMLKEGRVNTKIQYYAVTSLEGNKEEVRGIPIRKIDELSEYKDKSLVIVSVGKKYVGEVEENLKRLGFKHVILSSDL